jgi:alkanesulfonate monooxygenase SsuD/methylene tetrahydromethanopterin reductase-like flavin-dependent oxidoreductase (luciferase family)
MGGPHGPILDSWTTLAATAEATGRIRIGVLVTANLLRHPSLLAKIAVSVDHISGGRLEVGMGTGWNESAFTMLGMPFADVPERSRRLREACEVLKALWTQAVANYAGRYYSLQNAVSDPKPLQQPHPPIIVGGRGPKATLRTVALCAAGWNTSGGAGFEADLEASRKLDEYCAAIGRDPASIRRSVILDWRNAEQGLALAQRYVDCGFSEFVISVSGDEPVRQVSELARTALEPLKRLAVVSA